MPQSLSHPTAGTSATPAHAKRLSVPVTPRPVDGPVPPRLRGSPLLDYDLSARNPSVRPSMTASGSPSSLSASSSQPQSGWVDLTENPYNPPVPSAYPTSPPSSRLSLQFPSDAPSTQHILGHKPHIPTHGSVPSVFYDDDDASVVPPANGTTVSMVTERGAMAGIRLDRTYPARPRGQSMPPR